MTDNTENRALQYDNEIETRTKKTSDFTLKSRPTSAPDVNSINKISKPTSETNKGSE